MKNKWIVSLVILLFFSLSQVSFATEPIKDVKDSASSFSELYSFLPRQCWVKTDSYDLLEKDITLLREFVESSRALEGKKIQSAKVYPVSLPILLVSHRGNWKAHYFPQIRVLCNFGKETSTYHVSGIRFEKSELWIFSIASNTPCLEEIGSSEGFYSYIDYPPLYPSPYLFYTYYLQHLQSELPEKSSPDTLKGITLLFSAQIWNPFFYSDLPFIEQGSQTIQIEEVTWLSSSEELYYYLPEHYKVSKNDREITSSEHKILIDQVIGMMKNAGYENPNHFDWASARIDVPIIIQCTDKMGDVTEYFSDVAVYVSKIDKPDQQNRYLFSAFKDGQQWLFHANDQITSTDGWFVKMPRVYTFSGLSYNESSYIQYCTMIDTLLLNRYPIEYSNDITLMWSLKRWNFSSID
ncbi:MAG TPA: hypothetical protein PLE09_00035 [Caldisericia bacterium]|jgi:hypothetical protein|nr:hypothetical protein [Caldisericia bacterium]